MDRILANALNSIRLEAAGRFLVFHHPDPIRIEVIVQFGNTHLAARSLRWSLRAADRLRDGVEP